MKRDFMKDILIATDFSPAARIASVFGVQLAKALDANVILFNAYKVPHAFPALNVKISGYDVMMQTDKKLMDEADFLDPDHSLVEIMCDEGETDDVIITSANEKKVDLIVAGMKGTGRNLGKIFGSTAVALARNANVPLLLVPENAVYKTPRTMVFASDLGVDTDLQVLDNLAEIFQSFEPKIYVLTVLKNKHEEWFEVLHTHQTLKKASVTFSDWPDYPVDIDITNALNSFIEKHNADMLVMMPHRHEWLGRIFRKNETKDMIFHTHVSLLILPERMLEENQFLKRQRVAVN